MNMHDMHIIFREFAQQKGMQTTRGILQEDIDIHINVASLQKVSQILASNTLNTFGDKVSRQQYKISPVNSLRTLYKEDIINESDITGDGNQMKPYKISIDSENIMLYTGFALTYNNKTIYDCRIIEAEAIGQTIRDFSNRAAWDAPIITIFGDKNSIDCNIYTGTNEFKKPVAVKYNYIKSPITVRWAEDLNDCVNSDLPEYLQIDVILMAVDNYLRATNTNSQPSEQ